MMQSRSPHKSASDPRWSAKQGDVPSGDPDFHHSIGVLLAGGLLYKRIISDL